MAIRLAVPEEAERLWEIRNLAIRHGCKGVYEDKVITAWTPDIMQPGYRSAVENNPFFVVDGPGGIPVATGYLDLASGSVEAIFTHPDFTGHGYATQILDAIRHEALRRGFAVLTLSSTPNAADFYQRNGFTALKESLYPSKLAGASLRCVEMSSILQKKI